MTDSQENEVDKLRDIMESLPDAADHAGNERREYSLTKGDVLLIYRIAKVANIPHTCPFVDEERETLSNVAKNINRTQKIASGLVITGIVAGILSGIVYMVKTAIISWIKTNGGH